MQVFMACVPLFLCHPKKKYRKKFGGFKNNAYLCTAKMLMRYEEGRRCAAVFVSAILFINRPIGAAASGIRKDQVASHQQP